jgi:WD40 repeat protein
MDLERAEAIIKVLLAPKYLSPPQLMVFRSAWQGQSYRDLAETAGYEFNYIKGVGAQLWRILAVATSSNVSKCNFRQVLVAFIAQQNIFLSIEPKATRSKIDWGEAANSAFYGRELECDQLERWVLVDHCRLIAILGMGGMGKTTTSIELVQRLQSSISMDLKDQPTNINEQLDTNQFGCILWRSLLNAPPLTELLLELIQTLMTSLGERGVESPRLAIANLTAIDPGSVLANDPSARGQLQRQQIPKTLADRLQLLLEICQQHRCLIVLDNYESIFQAGAEVGEYRNEYADYGDLLSTFGRMNHQSCLILTSRENPTEISQLEDINTKVRTLILAGLEATAGQQIFGDRGCSLIQPSEWLEIDRYCGGNPLAFQLIAAAIQEVVDGNVSEILPYLRSSNLGFADIYMLLKHQWTRLTTEEQQIMYWLAIAREPMSVKDLAAALDQAYDHQHKLTPQSIAKFTRSAADGSLPLVAILQSLHRRSMIISTLSAIGDGNRFCSLQPMLMEYVTSQFVELICNEIKDHTPLLLNTHPITQATAPEYLRQAQLRLIVRPVTDRLQISIGNSHQIGIQLRSILTAWQRSHSLQTGYLAGNILNFLTYLKLDLTDLDCTELVIQQAYLVNIDLPRVNFTNTRLINCAFTQTFRKILAIAYSPDGQMLAASDSSGEIRLWSVVDHQCLLTLSGHTNWVRAIKFSPNGQYLASSSDDQTIALWDLQDGVCVATLGNGIHSLGLSFSPDGRYLASGSANQLIYYWDLHTSTCVRQFVGHEDWSIDVKFHPQGHQLVSCGADRTVRVWDVASGHCDRIWHGHENLVTTVDYSPDGQTVISGSLDGTLRIWDAATLDPNTTVTRPDCRLVLSDHRDEIWSVAFSPDGSNFASAGVNGLLKIWRTIDGYCLHDLEGHSDRLWSVAFHPDGDCLASGGEDRTIRLWQVSDGKCLHTLHGYTNWFRAISWSPDGQSLITASHDAQIRVWSLATEICQQLSGHTKSTTAVAYNPLGTTFASGSDDQTIRIWDSVTFTCQHVFNGHSGDIVALVYSFDGKYLVSGGSDLSIRIWDTHHWRCLSIKTGHTDRIGALAYHPHLNLVASASEDRTVRLWNLQDSTQVHTFSEHTNRAIAVAFDPLGTMLASGGLDRCILIWNIATQELCQTLIGHEGWILSLAYSPDGKWLFSGASDHTIKVWSMKTGLCVDTLIGHQSWIWSLAVSPSGDFLATASEDETIRLWDLADRQLISTRRARRPYEGMNISGVEGLTIAQLNDLKTLGAQT